MDIIAQTGIVVFGAVSIALIALGKRKAGFMFGLLSEPFWLMTSIYHEQWGIVVSAVWWGGWYGYGLYKETMSNEISV